MLLFIDPHTSIIAQLGVIQLSDPVTARRKVTIHQLQPHRFSGYIIVSSVVMAASFEAQLGICRMLGIIALISSPRPIYGSTRNNRPLTTK